MAHSADILFMICEVDGLEMYYEVRGEGVPVLMIHGFGIDHHVMTGCMEPIFGARPGWRRIYVDLPGMGRTKAGRVENSDQMLDTVVRFIEKIVPEGVFLVVGESYGGYLARGFVRRMPERLGGVLLICPVIVAERGRRRLPERRVFVRDREILGGIAQSEVRELFERMLVLQDRRRWERFQADIVPGMQVKDEVFAERLMKYGYPFSFDVDKLPRPFDRPALVLAGRQDATVGYMDALQIIENYPRGTFAVLDRAGHGLEVEQETVFERLANEWLNRVEEYLKG